VKIERGAHGNNERKAGLRRQEPTRTCCVIEERERATVWFARHSAKEEGEVGTREGRSGSFPEGALARTQPKSSRLNRVHQEREVSTGHSRIETRR